MNFLQGTLDLLLLNALTDGALHGYDIVEQLREKSAGVFAIEDGALYTSLHRMERRGWLEAEWRTSPKGRRAKYYRLTREGQAALRAGERSWNRFSGAVGKVFSGR